MTETSLKKRYIVKLLASIISGIIGMIMVAVVPKAIGPVAYGQFVYLQQFFTKIIGFLDATSSIAFFTKLSADSQRKGLIAFYSRYVIFIFFILISSFYSFDFFGINEYLIPDIDNTYIYLGLLFGFLTWFIQVLIKTSDAYAMTVSIEIVKVVHKIASLALLLCLITYSSLNLDNYFYFHISTLSIFILWVSILFKRNSIISLATFSIEFRELKTIAAEFISYCTPLFIYSIVGLIAGIFDIWLLQHVSGSIETGFYGLSYSIAAMCFIFTGAMTPIITREFSKSFEKKDIEMIGSLFKRYIPMLYTIAAYFSVFIALESENVLAIFTDEQFKNALYVLMIMAFYPIHQTYGQLSGSVFYATGQTKLYRNIGLIGMVIGTLLTTLFVYIFELGALGLAMKMVMTQLISVNIQLFYNAKFLNLKVSYYFKHQLLAIIILGIAAYVSGLCVDIESHLLDFLVSGVLYSFCVVMIFFIYPSLFSVSKVELKSEVAKVLSKMINLINK